MKRSKNEVEAIVSQELSSIVDPAIRTALQAARIEFREEVRTETGHPSKPTHRSWIIGDLHEHDVGITFTEDYPAAPGHRWGLAFLTINDSIGGRENWYPSLEMLYRDCGPWPTTKDPQDAA
jgi:hypothetical protein